jgi:hypothetical protein
VATDDNLNGGAYSNGSKDLSAATSYATGINAGEFVQPGGRWPANLILSYNEDEFELRSNVTSEQRKQLLLWMYENT